MWRAFDTKKQRRVTASEAVKEVGTSREARHEAYIEKRFVCPACKMEVSLRKSRSGKWYFSHVQTKNLCEYYYWSEKEEWAEEIHDEFKLWIREKLEQYGINAEIEKILDFGEYKLIPDVYFEINGKKVAVEVVVNSPRTKEEIIEKSKRYAEHDIYVLWIFYWKFKRNDGLTILKLARKPLREQKANKRMFRKDSHFRLIHALNGGVIFFFEDTPTKSGDPYSVITVHLLWDNRSNSLVGLMPWIINYVRPFSPAKLQFVEKSIMKRWPDGEIISGPFKIAIIKGSYPQKRVAILRYYFESRGYGIRLVMSVGIGWAHRFYLRRGKEYSWGVVQKYIRKNSSYRKWIVSTFDSWPKNKLLTRSRVKYVACKFFEENIRPNAKNIPHDAWKLPVLLWNDRLETGTYLGVSLREFWKNPSSIVFTEKDFEYLRKLGALRGEKFVLMHWTKNLIKSDNASTLTDTACSESSGRAWPSGRGRA